MIEFVANIVINTSPDEIFRHIADRENYPQWISAVSGANIAILSSGPFGEGTLIQEGPALMRVFHVQVNKGFELGSVRFDFLARLLLKYGHTIFQFEPAGQGTQVSWKAQIEFTPVLRLFDHFLARRAQQSVQLGLEQLKALLEEKERVGINKVSRNRAQRAREVFLARP